ncbi:unnamed protein product [Brassica rapa]|uniref:Gnk2-homologous domain-containing protein n=1 Tax=Brassica campestris TaxID=3711 RepID=A0A8D9CWD9_BRACM|nr:unnamed protein product [Brassica rapa]
MRKFPNVILFSCLLLLLTFIDDRYQHLLIFYQPLVTYSENLNSLFSSLASKVTANDGFYNTSTGEGPNKVYGLALFGQGYKKQGCANCVEQATMTMLLALYGMLIILSLLNSSFSRLLCQIIL